MDERQPGQEPSTRIEPNVGGSFSERYRGTQWGQPVEVVPIRPQRSTGSGMKVVGAVAGLVVVLLVGTLGAVSLLGPGGPMAPAPAALPLVPRSAVSSPAPSAGDPGSSAPGSTPSTSDASPAPDASRAPSAPATPPGSEVPAATPPRGTPAPLKGRRQVIDAMMARLSEPTSTARVEMEMSAAFAGETMRIDARFDVSGKDASGWMDIEGEGVSERIEMVMAYGMVHLRLPGSAWDSREVPDGEAAGVVGTVAVEDLVFMRYEGVVQREGQRLHRLTLVDLDWPLMTQVMLPDKGMELREVSMETLVDDFGRLVSQTMGAEGRMRNLEGRRVPMTMDMEIRYSRWGEPVTITVPRTLAPSG
jgi:hypothetical protein